MKKDTYTLKEGITGYKLYDDGQNGNIVAHTVGGNALDLMSRLVMSLRDTGHTVNDEWNVLA